MLVILATLQLFTFGFTADVEVWPKNIDDFLNSTVHGIGVEPDIAFRSGVGPLGMSSPRESR